jgi:hypothetical protein
MHLRGTWGLHDDQEHLTRELKCQVNMQEIPVEKIISRSIPLSLARLSFVLNHLKGHNAPANSAVLFVSPPCGWALVLSDSERVF